MNIENKKKSKVNLLFQQLLKNCFIIFFMIFFILSDVIFAKIDYANTSPEFTLNDYGKILNQYKTTTFDTAIFGNSTAVAGIRDEMLPSGCANLGIVYGKMTDFSKMLYMGFIKAEKEVILTANYLAFLDPLDTNETYPWHKQSYIPYVYFNRKNTADYMKVQFKKVIEGNVSEPVKKPNFERTVTRGRMTDEELKERVVSFDERFGSYTINDFSENIKALEDIYNYCKKNNLKLRFVWMPINPKFEPRPKYIQELKEKVNIFLKGKNIEYIDYTDFLSAYYFYDLGHINYEEGSVVFTKEFLKWLNK